MRVCKVLLAKSVYGWNFVKKDSKILVGLKKPAVSLHSLSKRKILSNSSNVIFERIDINF